MDFPFCAAALQLESCAVGGKSSKGGRGGGFLQKGGQKKEEFFHPPPFICIPGGLLLPTSA